MQGNAWCYYFHRHTAACTKVGFTRAKCSQTLVLRLYVKLKKSASERCLHTGCRVFVGCWCVVCSPPREEHTTHQQPPSVTCQSQLSVVWRKVWRHWRSGSANKNMAVSCNKLLQEQQCLMFAPNVWRHFCPCEADFRYNYESRMRSLLEPVSWSYRHECRQGNIRYEPVSLLGPSHSCAPVTLLGFE